MCKCRSHGTFPSSSKFFKVHLNICYHQDCTNERTDERSARARAPGFAATAAPSYSSGPGPCPDGRLGTVTQLPVHPASPVLLTKNGPLGALDSVARLNKAAAPSYLFKNSPAGSSYPEGNFGGNQLLDGSISLYTPLYPSRRTICTSGRCGPPPSFLGFARSGIVHHLSGQVCDGPNGEPTGRCERAAAERAPRARALPSTIVTMTSPQAFQQPGLGHRHNPQSAIRIGRVPSRSADPLSPFHIRPRHTAGPHPLPSRQFQALFDSLFKVLFIFFFPRGTCSLSVSRLEYLALDGIYRPIGAAFPNNPTRRGAPRGATGSGHDGALPLSAPPSRGLGPGPPLRTLLQTTIQTPEATDFHGGLFPVRSPLLRESLLVSFPPLIDMLKLGGPPRPRSRGLVRGVQVKNDARVQGSKSEVRRVHGGRHRALLIHRLAARTLGPVPLGLVASAQLAFKDSMVHGILAIHTKYRISLRSSSMQEPRYPAEVCVLSGKEPAEQGTTVSAPTREGGASLNASSGPNGYRQTGSPVQLISRAIDNDPSARVHLRKPFLPLSFL
ncbi:hypothetical protein Fmac_028174 [Flemingia macrophylla]|uniref:Uncharacterized protein n=1 Tax=Flemingia macrophylla TaxID=520843 RepID=A0ABD1L870_9FABA